MQPDGRSVSDFRHKRRGDDEESDDEDDEDRRTVSRIVIAQVEPAAAAGLGDFQKSGVESSLSAAGATAAEPGAEGGNPPSHP